MLVTAPCRETLSPKPLSAGLLAYICYGEPAAAAGTWAVGVGVAEDGGGSAVQIGVHVQVTRAQVALDQQLILLCVAPAHHQVAAPQHRRCW